MPTPLPRLSTLASATAMGLLPLLASSAWAADPELPSPPEATAPTPVGASAAASASGEQAGWVAPEGASWWERWRARVREGRAEQPDWAVPLVTGTGCLLQQFRYDQREEQLPNDGHLRDFDGGQGLRLMPTMTEEVALRPPAYEEHVNPRSRIDGWDDWPLLGLKQRLLSANAPGGGYVLSATLGVQEPTGKTGLTNHAWEVTPSLAGGIGWEKWDLQATVGTPLPLRLASSIGWSVTGSAALQYRFQRIWWPELEVNAQRWWDGQRNGFTQSYLTPGIVVGSVPVGSTGMGAEVGVGYQYALSPTQRERPTIPGYSHAWIGTARIDFD